MTKTMPSTNVAPAKILLVDDHPAVREALAARIAQQEDLEVCGEAEDALAGLQKMAETSPDVIITDISLKKSDGIDLIKRIMARDASAKVLVWSMHSEQIYAERALRAGAKGYITKEHATQQIIGAIRDVMAGKMYFSPAVSDLLMRRAADTGTATASGAATDILSDREFEVFRLIGAGIKNDAIAQQLHISIKTVETHRERIKRKLNLKDATELIRHATLWLKENP